MPAGPQKGRFLSRFTSQTRGESDLPPIADGHQQATSQIAAKAATAGLLTCLVLAPLGAGAGVLALMSLPTSTSNVAPAAVDTTAGDHQARAEEFAQQVVLTWLGTTVGKTDDLHELVSGAEDGALITSREAYTVADPAVAGVVQAAQDTWTITIAATLTDSRTNSLKPQVRRYFQVPIQVNADGEVAALSLPTPISPPVIGSVSISSEYELSLSTTGTAGQTVGQFLAAYLTGTGDVARYLTPGVALSPLQPAPYASVALENLRAAAGTGGGGSDDQPNTQPNIDAPGDGERIRVLATATASVTQTQSSVVSYALTLTARAGRWEITAIDTSPLLPSTAPSAPGQGVAQDPGPAAAEELQQTPAPGTAP